MFLFSRQPASCTEFHKKEHRSVFLVSQIDVSLFSSFNLSVLEILNRFYGAVIFLCHLLHQIIRLGLLQRS